MLTPKDYLEIYRDNLNNHVIPFWLKNSLDRTSGGYFSCLDRDGSIYDTKKYIWLLGREVWMFSKLYNDWEAQPDYLEAARLGIEFLDNHATDDKGRFYFCLTQQGKPVKFQRKPYGAVFAMLAYLEYSKATQQESYLQKAVDIFGSVREWIKNPELIDAPSMEGVPPTRRLADSMVLASMAIELKEIDDRYDYLKIITDLLEEIKGYYDPKNQVFIENVLIGNPCDIDWKKWPESRLFLPGHSIETAWFALHMAQLTGDEEAKKMALDVIQGSLERGWDKEYGGLFYFMDIENKPTLQLESTMKLWWPHNEAIYATILAYSETNDDRWLCWLEKVHRYSFDHFVDTDHGGWFGYCDRQGNLTHTCKGGNYKGFFHVPRALLYSLKLLEQL